MDYNTLKNAHEAFARLLQFSEAQDTKLTLMGKGLNPQTEHGDIHAQARGWLRVLDRMVQDAALDELTRMAQEDGFY